MSWNDVSQIAPRLPRGWFELMGLAKQDRLDFFLEYWSSILAFENKEFPGICRFFSLLETLEVYLCRTAQGPFDVKMLYIFQEERCCFQGEPPLMDLDERSFPLLRDDHYRRFFSVHNGFSKLEDEGILSYRSLAKVQQKLRQQLVKLGYIYPENDCCSLGLFPFYGYEEPLTYQCFLLDPEICGNFSSPSIIIGEQERDCFGIENLEVLQLKTGFFPSFLSWLEAYLHSENVYDR